MIYNNMIYGVLYNGKRARNDPALYTDVCTNLIWINAVINQ